MMTEDQSGQAWEGGHVVRGEVIAEGAQGAEGQPRSEQAAPVTYFHKVASAAHRDEPDDLDADDQEDEREHEEDTPTRPMQVAAVTSPEGLHADDDEDSGDSGHGDGSGGRDYWDAPAGDRDDVVPVTRADALASSAAAASAVPAAPAAPAAPVAPMAPAADPNPVIAAPPPSNYGSLLSDTADLRSQWQQIQFMFVDDPRASVTEAADVIEQVAAKLQEAIQERQRALRDRWDGGTHADTEALRETLRMYRAFLYQLIGSSGTPGS